jgi:hypothetical protein
MSARMRACFWLGFSVASYGFWYCHPSPVPSLVYHSYFVLALSEERARAVGLALLVGLTDG